MTDDLMAAIARSNDRNWLVQCRDFNRERGRKDVVKAAELRLRDLDLRDALRVQTPAQSIEGRVMEALRVYRELLRHKHGRNQAAGYTERDIRKHGPRGAVIATLRRPKKTEGLRLLEKHGRLDCSYEQIALDYASEMPEDVVERARQTLAELQAEGEGDC